MEKWGWWICQEKPAQRGIFEDRFFREYPVTQEQYMSSQRRLGAAAERLNDSRVIPTEDNPFEHFPSLEEIVGQ
jgi:hypothetical protein